MAAPRTDAGCDVGAGDPAGACAAPDGELAGMFRTDGGRGGVACMACGVTGKAGVDTNGAPTGCGRVGVGTRKAGMPVGGVPVGPRTGDEGGSAGTLGADGCAGPGPAAFGDPWCAPSDDAGGGGAWYGGRSGTMAA
jgi:hypothetical protein